MSLDSKAIAQMLVRSAGFQRALWWSDADPLDVQIAAALDTAYAAGVEDAARFVETHVRAHLIENGRVVWREDDEPDRLQQAYAAAIRALTPPAPTPSHSADTGGGQE